MTLRSYLERLSVLKQFKGKWNKEGQFFRVNQKKTKMLLGPRGPGLAGCLGGRRGKHLSVVWQERRLLRLLSWRMGRKRVFLAFRVDLLTIY